MRWEKERKIVTMPIHGSSTPEVVLERTLERVRAGHVKQILVAIVWNDGISFDCDWSDGRLIDLAYALRIGELNVNKQMLDQSYERDRDELPPEDISS